MRLRQQMEHVEERAHLWVMSMERVLRVVVLVVVLGSLLALWLLRESLQDLKVVGYPGVFLFSFLGSFSMVLPVPGLLSVCGVAILLNPVAVGLVAGVAETLGETSGYAVGYGGRAVIENRRFYRRLSAWMRRRGSLILFLVSVIPNPVVDIVGITAGGLRFPITRFLLVVWVGKTIKGIAVAYACSLGFQLLPWLR